MINRLRRPLEWSEDVARYLASIRDVLIGMRLDHEHYAKTRVCVVRVMVGNVVLAEDEHARPDSISAGVGIRVGIDYRLVDGTIENFAIHLQRPAHVHYDGRVWFEVMR